MRMRFVDCDGGDYQEALALRHRVFYQASGMALQDVADAIEAGSLHVVARAGARVCGYGRLTLAGSEAQISQVVVSEAWRRRGVGAAIMAVLTRTAAEHGIVRLHLAAELHALPFYRQFGFREIGDPYPSPRLGIPVVRMELACRGQ